MGITLPRVSYQQGNGGQAVARDKMRPGDLVFWDINDRNNGADHVAIYIGGGKVVEALKPGTSVKVASLRGNYWARRYT
jgi:cell wall-associated NlpC family hydrolase